jgi:hypothetical protein
MGHRDITTTQRYADYAPSEHEGEMVEAAFSRRPSITTSWAGETLRVRHVCDVVPMAFYLRLWMRVPNMREERSAGAHGRIAMRYEAGNRNDRVWLP